MAGKRDSGTGTIYKRGPGRWAGKVMMNGTIRYVSGATKTEVAAKLRALTAASRQIEPNKISLASYAEQWLITYKMGTLKPSSYDRLENTIKKQINPSIGSIGLQQILPSDVQKLLKQLKTDGKSYSTVKKTYDALGMIFKHATINDHVAKNPMLSVIMPPKSQFDNNKEIRYFTESEVSAIVEESSRCYSNCKYVYPYRNAILLALNTGMRMGELIALKKADVDRKAKTIHVRCNLQSVKKRREDGSHEGGMTLVENTTKTYSGDRYIPLNNNAMEVVRELLQEHPESPYLICSSKGSVVPPERLERSWYRLLDNAGITRVGFHTLRHTFASILFNREVDIKSISKILGHASIQITMNTYVHLMNKADHKAVAKLDDLY